MLQYDRLWECLTDIGAGDWRSRIEALLHLRLSRAGHGDFIEWQETLAALSAADPADTATLRKLLLKLAPWRKGPFDVANIHVDSEWRSDLKWDRLADAIAPLESRNVLDVGCGNGYYARRMCDAGARSVITTWRKRVLQIDAHRLHGDASGRKPLRLTVVAHCFAHHGNATRFRQDPTF